MTPSRRAQFLLIPFRDKEDRIMIKGEWNEALATWYFFRQFFQLVGVDIRILELRIDEFK